MLEKITIQSMFGGIAGMQYFTDGYLAGIAVDPDMPIGSDVKASGCLQDSSGVSRVF